MKELDKVHDVGEGYRIPSLEEFVQGFEFEVAYDSKAVMIFGGDLTKDQITKMIADAPKRREWYPRKVWWKADPRERITTKEGDYTVTVTGAVNNFFKPFDEKSFIDQGLVRVKI